MSQATDSTTILPTHIEATIASISRLHEQHRRGATPVQRAVDAVTRFVARPRFAGLVALGVTLWIVGNALAPRIGLRAFDPWPFNGLQGVTGVIALFMTVFILITDRRENELSQLREQLTLELAMLGEQKAAKLIALVEELRRDMPSVPNRRDAEAEDLAQPADPEAVLEALKESQTDEVGDLDVPMEA